MKNFIAKLKEANYKQLLIEHGEKGVFGLIGMFVLICFAGTSWSRYDKQPEDFQKKVDAGNAAISASAWTVDREKEFKPKSDILVDVERLHNPLDIARFEYSTPWFWPMYPQQERVREPKWLAPIEVLADAGKTIIIETPEPPQGDLLAQNDPNAKKDADAKGNDEGSETAPRNTALGGGETDPRQPGGLNAGPGPGPGIGNPGRGGGAFPGGGDGGGRRGAGGRGGGRMMPPGMGLGDGEAGFGMGTFSGQPAAINVKSRGLRFVAVRGLFPLKDQIAELEKAMHETSTNAAGLIIFLDFELQRQVAVPGNNPWSGPWTPVDLEAAMEVLGKVDFDVEVVNFSYTDAVFTMPLPKRAAGFWSSKHASHPKIKQLDQTTRDMQRDLEAKLIEAAQKMKKEDNSVPKGFANVQYGVRDMRASMGDQDLQRVMNELQAKMGTGAGEGNEELNNLMQSYMGQVQNTNVRMMKYLLFRYLDFDVSPGNAYRYRVRLVMNNPNYKRNVEELVDSSVAEGELRFPQWADCEPTSPVYLPEEQKVFLTKVDRPKGESGPTTAFFNIFQWFADAGTNISAKLEKLQLGQWVGGSTQTEVLRPANETFKEESVPIFTGALLADVAMAPIAELDAIEHSDLKLDAKRLKGLGVDKALIIDRYGQLSALDPLTSADDLISEKQALENQNKPWEFLKLQQQQQEAAGGGNDLTNLSRRFGGGAGGKKGGAGPGDAGGPGMGGGMPGGGGYSSPTKKKGSKSSNSGGKKSTGS